MTVNASLAPIQELNIVVLGYIVRGPLGGLAWHHLQYALGLSLLGHRVTFIEDSDDYDSCYNPTTGSTGRDATYGLEFARRSFNEIGIGDCWAYHDAHSKKWHGPRAEDAIDHCRNADLLLNLSAVNPLREWLLQIDIRALIDTDPVFTQLNHLQNSEAAAQAMLHTHYLSFGENINRPDCTVPTDGLNWIATRQPVVPECWSGNQNQTDTFKFTTIAQWDSYPAREYQGKTYGMKSASFAQFMELPDQCNHHLEIALGSTSAPREQLESIGWKLRDSQDVTKTIQSYRDYLQHSSAEFGISKHGYVSSHSGWFSERSINYLACGKPVVVQDTGFQNWLNSDRGVLPFSNTEEALHALDAVQQNYTAHCEAALEITHEYFHYKPVLNKLLENLYASHSEIKVAIA